MPSHVSDYTKEKVYNQSDIAYLSHYEKTDSGHVIKVFYKPICELSPNNRE